MKKHILGYPRWLVYLVGIVRFVFYLVSGLAILTIVGAAAFWSFRYLFSS